MQAFQTSVYCGLGIFHFFFFGIWFLVFRFGFDVVFRFSYVGTTFFSIWAALISNSCKLISNSCKLISNSCETSLSSTCHCWRSSRNLIVEMSKFIGFACGFWYWSNFFPVFRFWMIFFMVLWFLIDPNTSLNMHPDIWIAYWWSLSGDEFDWIQFTCRQECNNLLTSASL